MTRFFGDISIVVVLLSSRLEFTTKGKWISFALKSPKEGTVLRSGRLQVRRKSECLKGSQNRESAHRCIQWSTVGRGENWMKHGSVDAVCSFQATGLCNLFANPGYYGTTGSVDLERRCSASLLSSGIFVCVERNNKVSLWRELAFLWRIMRLVNKLSRGLSPETGWKRRMRLIRVQ